MGTEQEDFDQEIFESATSTEAPKETPVEETPTEETPSEESEKPGRLAGRKRDEKGRVLPKEPEPEVAEEPTPPESKPEPKEPQSIPLTVLLEEREKRQNEQRQREQLQQQLWALQQRLQAQEKPPEPVDMFADPQAWEQTLQTRNEAWRKQVMGEQSLRNARLVCQVQGHPEVFDEAYAAMQQRFQSGDETLKQQFISSPDPGEMMVNWYQREKTLATVGPDPESFLARALDAALENPEFLARAVEKARGVASTKPSQTKLPPSLSRATASSNSGESVSGTSDEELFKEAWR